MKGQKQDVIVLRGGLDIVTPALQLPPGAVIACQNYESEVRGYRRMQGYERYDGQGKPSEASYWVLDFDSGSTEMTEGDTVTGDTSGATGIVLTDATLGSGTYGGGDAAGYVVLYDVSGTFTDNEGLEVSAANVATADGTALEKGADNDTDDETWLQAAIEKRRTAISAITGSGDVLGVCTMGGDVYAFRNNAGGTAAVMFKATTAGWSAQSFGDTLTFTTGSIATIVEGETVTGDTSGATATVERVVIQSGTFGGSDAAGYLVLSGTSGTFQAAETVTGGTSTGTVVPTGAQAAITLPAGGKYRSVVHNFYGTSNLRRLYFTNGEGYAHEWDGSVLAPIRTGLSSSLDKPNFLTVHSNHLMLGYDGGAIQFSGTGLPLSFMADDGAGEIGFGETITGLKSSTRTATIVTGRNKIGYLQGTDSTNFTLDEISPDSGAIADTLEVIGQPYFLDDAGVRSLTAAQEFGDWNTGTITRQIEPLIAGKRNGGISPVGALRVRAKDQYRLFYDDKTVICLYFGRQAPEPMTFLLEFTPTCVHSGETSAGDEVLFAGDDAGYVYQMDAGASADGAAISAYIRTPFVNQGAPQMVKRYHRALIEAIGGGADTTLYFSSDYSFGDPDTPTGIEDALAFAGGGGFWDVSLWDEFYWDAGIQSQAWAELNGIGKNISLAIMSDVTYEDPHTLSSITINFTPRRMLR